MRSAQASFFARSVTPPLKCGPATAIWRQEADMAQKPDRLAWMVLAMAVTIPAITTWAAPRILRASRQRRSRRGKRFIGLNTGICIKGSASSPAEMNVGWVEVTPPGAARMASHIERRKFLATLGGAAAGWPLAARAQQPGKLATIGFLGAPTPSAWRSYVPAFVQRLNEL